MRATPVVALDCALYDLSESRYDLLIGNLAKDPLLGTSEDGLRYEYLFNGLSVHYILTMESDGMYVYLTGVRPPEAISRTRKAALFAGKTIEVLKEIQGLLSVFKIGKK